MLAVTSQKLWPPLEHRRWTTLGSIMCFVLGSISMVLFFAMGTSQEWAASVLLIYGPLLLGLTGIILGIISQRWYLTVLNLLPPLVFPAVMFFGMLILGP